MPHYTHHAVYNLDETVAVSENPFFSAAIEESAFELYQTKYLPFAHVNESKAFVHKR